ARRTGLSLQLLHRTRTLGWRDGPVAPGEPHDRAAAPYHRTAPRRSGAGAPAEPWRRKRSNRRAARGAPAAGERHHYPRGARPRSRGLYVERGSAVQAHRQCARGGRYGWTWDV
ncbi:MAG: hypothetical protein AVDCRST_MAG77-38, partial [uncultured Chloroflexi bacterium]